MRPFESVHHNLSFEVIDFLNEKLDELTKFGRHHVTLGMITHDGYFVL